MLSLNLFYMYQGGVMQISENTIEHLIQWKTDIEKYIHINPHEWENMYPLYAQINFWVNIKKREMRNECGDKHNN